MSEQISRRWLVAQIGARRHYAIPGILARAGELECLYTDLCAETLSVRIMRALVPGRLRPAGIQRLMDRAVPDVPRSRIRSFPMFAVRRTAAGGGTSRAASYKRWLKANSEFNNLVLRGGFGEADAVYVFNGAGLEVLDRARSLGLRTVVDQTDAPVAVEETLLGREREDWPDWEPGQVSPRDWLAMADREQAEWELADTIICGSAYVKEGIDSVAGPVSRCRVVPYGYDSVGGPGEFDRDHQAQRALRVLFAGTLCLRKGIQYLWEAARKLPKKEFHVRAVGGSALTGTAESRLAEVVDVRPPVPRSEMRRQYEWADVLVAPSISEGSANVCYEALMEGVPVIATANAGSVVRDNQEGFIVPIRESAAIEAALQRLASDRRLLSELSRRAASRAEEFSRDHYAHRLLKALEAPEPTVAMQ